MMDDTNNDGTTPDEGKKCEGVKEEGTACKGEGEGKKCEGVKEEGAACDGTKKEEGTE